MVRHYCDRCECELGDSPFTKLTIKIALNITENTISEKVKQKEYCHTCYDKIIAILEGDE